MVSYVIIYNIIYIITYKHYIYHAIICDLNRKSHIIIYKSYNQISISNPNQTPIRSKITPNQTPSRFGILYIRPHFGWFLGGVFNPFLGVKTPFYPYIIHMGTPRASGLAKVPGNEQKSGVSLTPHTWGSKTPQKGCPNESIWAPPTPKLGPKSRISGDIPVFWGFRGVPNTLFTAPHVQTVQILYHEYNVLYSFVQNGSLFSKVDFQ